MKIRYRDITFRAKSLRLIETANSVIEEYSEAGYQLTLRQLYYQLVARGYIENTPNRYDSLGETINNARLAGLVDWDAIVDRGRYLRGLPVSGNPQEALRQTAQEYHRDWWAGQQYHVEVWIEKDALVDVIGKAAAEYDVDYLSCRGYCSQSTVWSRARSLRWYEAHGQKCCILYLGDHDPSGIDMTRDIRERLSLFGSTATVERLALSMEQIRQYNPPPNPAKTTDSRCREYIQRYGKDSWELDALEPRVLNELIQSAILNYLDRNTFLQVQAQEQREKKRS